MEQSVNILQPATTYYCEVEAARSYPYRPCNYPAAIGDPIYQRQQFSFTTPGEGVIARAEATSDPTAAGSLGDQLDLYPNPGSGTLTVTFPSTGFGRIKVANLQGQILQTVEVNSQVRYTNLDLGKLPTGIYVVTALGSSGQQLSARYVKEQ